MYHKKGAAIHKKEPINMWIHTDWNMPNFWCIKFLSDRNNQSVCIYTYADGLVCALKVYIHLWIPKNQFLSTSNEHVFKNICRKFVVDPPVMDVFVRIFYAKLKTRFSHNQWGKIIRNGDRLCLNCQITFLNLFVR